MKVCLTIAGSDSGGGAGIQADLKVFAALGVHGTSAITCLTAQNPSAVTGIHAAPPAFVVKQIAAVRAGFPLAAAKTGMLYSAAIVRAVARAWARGPRVPLVVDPVMGATSGAQLLRADAVRALARDLLPLATVVTPNLPEAEILAGVKIRTESDMATAARRIHARFGCACVVKGGHLDAAAPTAGRGVLPNRANEVLPNGARDVPGTAPDTVPPSRGRNTVLDILFDGRRLHRFRARRVPVRETHGTGCTFSAALAAGLAHGASLPRATAAAQRFVAATLRRALSANPR